MIQPNAAKLAREIYGDTTEYASDLVNSYAWDTTIIFIQTYSEMSNYASQNKSTLFSNSGINNDKYCNIWDMSGNAMEWTTEYSNNSLFLTCTFRGGNCEVTAGEVYCWTSKRGSGYTTTTYDYTSFRSILYVK